MKEIDFFPEAQEATAQPETAEASDVAPEAAKDTPEVTEGQGPQTLGYRSGGISDIGQPRGEPGKLYSDPECRHPISGAKMWRNVYDHNGQLISFGSGTPEVSDTPEAMESAETAESVQETQEGEETLGYSSEYYKHQAASAVASGNRIAYNNAMKNYGKALVKERTKL